MTTQSAWLALAAAALLLFSGCSEKSEEKGAWQNHLAYHTTGTVGARSDIEIVFNHDIIPESAIGKDASAVLEFSPKVDAKAYFYSSRVIAVTPATRLTPGQNYKVKLKAKSPLNLPKELGEYSFNFAVVPQRMEISLGGLSADRNGSIQISGVCATADEADPAKVQEVLKADHEGRPLSVRWAESDGKNHRFFIDDVQKADTETTVRLSWNGNPIGAAESGEERVTISALGAFEVLAARVTSREKKAVVIEFSSPLRADQNLRGLLSLEGEPFSVSILGNQILLYPSKAFEGTKTLRVEPGIRSESDSPLASAFETQLQFTQTKPVVQFVESGVILPESDRLSVPFEAAGVHSVQLTAFEIKPNNIAQFLQVNPLGGNDDLVRVGRYLWHKTVKLNNPRPEQKNRYWLDVSELVAQNPGSLFYLKLSIDRGNSAYTCSDAENAVPVRPARIPGNYNGWNYEPLVAAEDKEWAWPNWSERNNPCKDAYYYHGDSYQSGRNFIASNIGLIAKMGDDGKLKAVVTDLRTAEPIANAQVRLMSYQNQTLSQSQSNQEGMADLDASQTPFYLMAEHQNDRAYLRLNPGGALSVSHFQTGGAVSKGGLKGLIYGERGVWRPGDTVYLTFLLSDRQQSLPENHPVTMTLYNPRGQKIYSQTNHKPVGGFYGFAFETSPNDLTGQWTARAELGGAVFTRSVRIETVMPNRLKAELDFDGATILRAGTSVKGKLFGQWLQGASAAGLKATVSVKTLPAKTAFGEFSSFVFDDPVRKIQPEPQTLFSGALDENGNGIFEKEIWTNGAAPGMMSAELTTMIYEKGGAFSTSRTTLPFSPYSAYVGMMLPPSPSVWGLETGKTHKLELVSVDAQGKLNTQGSDLEVSLYKISWRWWWDQSGQSLAEYANTNLHTPVQKQRVQTKNGRAAWDFKVADENWGRYLLRVCDRKSKHCTGNTFYIDWPYGRQNEGAGGDSASMLVFEADKERYKVGETAKITLPAGMVGRALISLEQGGTLLRQYWKNFDGKQNVLEVALDESAAPNIYAHVMLLQPHKNKQNDRPIRLYGVIPLMVDNPKTILEPVVNVPQEWKPQSKVKIGIKEASGRAMDYSLVVVDEGLLGLTGFKTPNPRDVFYQKESLQVKTWDLFDQVSGAYGSSLERLLAIGGSDSEEQEEGVQKRRFPPVVKHLGYFRLKAGASAEHELELPRYVGAVRVMVVAANGENAYGRAENSVFVRDALMLLPTLPRVIGPTESITVPVSIFAAKEQIGDVDLVIKGDRAFSVSGEGKKRLNFQKPAEKMAFFKVSAGQTEGMGTLSFTAQSDRYRAEAVEHLQIRQPNAPITAVSSWRLEPGESMSEMLAPLKNLSAASIEASLTPPMNLGKRLGYLIAYPHGCLEQRTSAVFPQLFVAEVTNVDAEQKREIEANIAAGIEQIRALQDSSGGFLYWPGAQSPNAWGTTYAGHFLLEAKKRGYQVPDSVLESWKRYQSKQAAIWVGRYAGDTLDQAYRLYTLALAGAADIGAMNRLRQSNTLEGVARWQLALAYQQAGQSGAALALLEGKTIDYLTYEREGLTYGSALRDRAIALMVESALGRTAQADKLANEISASLSSDEWHSTQTTAFALMAMGSMIKDHTDAGPVLAYRLGDRAEQSVKAKTPIYRQPLELNGLEEGAIKVSNGSKTPLYVSLTRQGTPPAGEEEFSQNGLVMTASYFVPNTPQPLDPGALRQGSDVEVMVRVENRTGRDLSNIALIMPFASGWEILNARYRSGEEGTEIEYQDVRDDRVSTYFALSKGKSATFRVLINAAYLGRFYLPGASVEAMYDGRVHARHQGRWIEVVENRAQ